MFTSNDSIKFMMAKIFFNLAEFSYKEYTAPSNLQFHGADTIVINFVKNGEGKVIINNNEYNIKKNSYFVIPQFQKYQIIPDTELDIYSIYLLIDKSTGYTNYFYLLEKTFVGIDVFNVDYLFDTLLFELKNKKFGYNEIVVSMFKSIIVYLLRNENINEKRLSHWDLDSNQYQIESIMQNEFNTITLKDLADRLYMSERELQRYLIANYKKSFINLRNDARMSFASNRLIYSDDPISKISDDVGYSTIEHFSYAFKNYYGTSPLKYRKEYKK